MAVHFLLEKKEGKDRKKEKQPARIYKLLWIKRCTGGRSAIKRKLSNQPL